MKDNNKRSRSATQTSAYSQNFDQLLGTREDISSKNITQVSVEEGPLLSDWDKIEPPENNFDSETTSSSQQNMENESGNIVSSCIGRNLKISRYLDKLCDQNVACFMKKNYLLSSIFIMVISEPCCFGLVNIRHVTLRRRPTYLFLKIFGLNFSFNM